jgi:hypothetical protein
MVSAMGGGHYPYQLHISAALGERVRQLQRQASREGRGREYLEAIRTVVERLRTDPTEFGEPLYRLRALRVQVRSASVRPLFIDFGVCEDLPLVFLKSVKLLALPATS